MKITTSNFLEWGGVITAILYSLLIALNIKLELLGFSLLLLSSLLIGFWSYINMYKGILLLQIFYFFAAIIGLI